MLRDGTVTAVDDPASDSETRRRSCERVTQALEWPMAILALTVIPALLIDSGTATPRVHLIATSVNWFVWLAFCGEFILRAAVAPDRRVFVRRSWVDLVIIVVTPPFAAPETLQAVRAVRAVRILRLLRIVRAAAFLSISLRASRRALQHRKFHYVLLVALGIVLLGATGLYVIEGDQNDSVKTFGDALWWAVTTATTVGYGDIYPHTGEGRLIAVVLMLTGIGVIGMFTATIANFFMVEQGEGEIAELRDHLKRIEYKLDRTIEELRAARTTTVATRSEDIERV